MAADHADALLDWLACAAGGWDSTAARAARSAADGPEGRAAALGAAGHVLDFDDTYAPGLSHLSAAVAPAALTAAADAGAPVDLLVRAFARGLETMAVLARASHPALYERGWHPTAVCGTVGAADAAAAVLGLDEAARESALALALLRATGSRGGFGSEGKALGVGLAAGAGLGAARLAAAGARVPLARAAAAFEAVTDGAWALAGPGSREVELTWFKPWPCCLMAHAPIEAALELRSGGLDAREAPDMTIRVHPRARQAAAYDHVEDGLQAKFSIPYLTAFALLHGSPRVADFDAVRADARDFAARRLSVVCDEGLGESEVRLEDRDGLALARVGHSIGSPERPMDAATARDKRFGLAGDRLEGILDDPGLPAAAVLARLGP